jgi:hypothetical protein
VQARRRARDTARMNPLRRGLSCGACAMVALALGQGGVRAAGEKAHVAAAQAPNCPLKPSSAAPRGEAWAFTSTAAPAGAHAGIASTYTHGRGTWTHGRGRGTICRADTATSGPAHNIVLSVGGRARVSPGIMRLGRKGVGLVLTVTVSASDYAACAPGTRGTVTIFASYYETHHDRVQFRFASACTAENATFSGSALRALIAREGLQVNRA